MITETCQRWREHRESRRPAGEVIKTAAYDVTSISSKIAKAFVEAHHYSGTFSPASHRFGLHLRGDLVGVAVFGCIPSMAAHRAVWPTFSLTEAVSLGRLVLLDEVPGNGESWFVSRCFEQLALRGVVAVESCADPEPRQVSGGTPTHRGHVGTVYQATNGRYVGKTNPASLRLFPDGTSLSARTCSKISGREQGCEYSSALLVRWGAEPLRGDEDSLAWIKRWAPMVTRKHRHQGNHRYLWALDKRRRAEVLATHGGMGPMLAYPKLDR